MPASLAAAFPPSNCQLLDVARRAVDDAMLRTIAEADYGIGADDFSGELRSIRNTGILPLTLRSWDVLTLTVFSEPAGEDRDYHMRSFACALVLRGQFEGCGGGVAEVALTRCLVSVGALGEEMNRAIGSFLTWAIPLAIDADCWLFKLGLLIVAARVFSDQSTEPILGEAAAWVLAEEDASRSSAFERPPAPFGLQHGFWRPLAAELIDRAATVQTQTVRDDLGLLGQFVLGAA